MISLKKNEIGIFILAYKRLNHLKKTIYRLKKFIHANDTIHIFMDNFSDDQTSLEIKKIKAVKKYLNNLDKKKFTVIFRRERFGMKKNWILAYDYMFKKYKKVICLEDDILIKESFINFMIFYLNYYEKNNKIMNITGFGTKIKIPKKYSYDCYLTKRSMSWGQGSWRRVWIKFSKMKKDHKSIITNKVNKLKLISCGEDLLRTMTLDYLKLAESIQVWWIWNIIRNNGLSINPINSLVDNIGYDGTGYHTKLSKKFPKNFGIISNKKRMLKVDFDQKLNSQFIEKFKIKTLTFNLFNILPIKLIKILIKLKKILKI